MKDGLRVVMADIDDTSGQTVQKRLKTVYKHISFVKVDVCQSKDIDNCISKAADVLGVIDVAVNSCGDIGRLAEAQDISWDDWRHVMDIGLDGAWRFSTAMVRYFRAQEPRLVRHDLGNARAWSPVYQKGSLVNIAASVGHVGHRLMAPYCMRRICWKQQQSLADVEKLYTARCIQRRHRHDVKILGAREWRTRYTRQCHQSR